MLHLKNITTDHSFYQNAEALLHESFPPEERRDESLQRQYTDHHPMFNTLLITDDEKSEPFIGVITIWDFGSFIFAENFATTPACRNQGYGKRIMEKLLEQAEGRLVVLEVERPEDEMSKRRIGFYQRCGFKLCLEAYMQPPYHPGDELLPLYIMYHGAEDITDNFQHIKATIYKEVYHYMEQ